jgi:DAK2 domain fusion protein YloV
MARRTCDGPGLRAAFRAGVDNLEAHVEEINGLNVFPVPDGDTGSNMVATVRAALEEAERLERPTAASVGGAISFGSLMGARGNSGVITSQILRGIAEGLAGKNRFNGLDLAHALDLATTTAYAAVAKPGEGTILTVIREAAAAARVAADTNEAIEPVLAAAVDGAAAAVAKTPSLLAILREAGVVDSGGQGLFRLLEGSLRHVRGTADAPTAVVSRPARSSAPPAAAGAGAPARPTEDADEYGYETMFVLRARPGETLDPAAIRVELEAIGESVLVAGDGSALKVHVHNDRPDLVIAHGLGAGTLSRITVENLDSQASDVREERAAAFAGSSDAAPGPGDDRRNGTEPAGLAVIAVAAGDGIARIFDEEFGVAAIVRGGQSANPSTGELLEAVRATSARELLILPNNPNVILAARQVAELADRPVRVVPTRNAAEGFAALLSLDPAAGAAANVATMTEAARSIQSLAVTRATRDATFGGQRVKRGETIVLDPDDGLVARHRDGTKAVLAAVAGLDPGFEIVTLFYGADVELADAEELARAIGALAPGVEVEVRHGGQPHYGFLVSVE